MPQASDITVKKYDGTTDVVYSLISASGGDKSPAIFRSQAIGNNQASRPTFTAVVRDNGAKTGRRIDLNYFYPGLRTDPYSGLTVVDNKAVFSLSGLLPLAMGDGDLYESGAQFAHLISSPLIVQLMTHGANLV